MGFDPYEDPNDTDPWKDWSLEFEAEPKKGIVSCFYAKILFISKSKWSLFSAENGNLKDVVIFVLQSWLKGDYHHDL